MPVFEVVLEQSYFGQQVINRWNYYTVATTAAVTLSFALVKAMGFIADGVPPVFDSALLFSKMRMCQSPQLTYVQVISKSIYDLTDFYSLPFAPGLAGTVVDPVAAGATFEAYGLHSNQVRRDIRAGQKRIAGTDSNHVLPGGALAQRALDPLGELCTVMNTALTYDDEGNSISFVPIIVQKETTVDSEGKKHTNYYHPEAAQVPGHVAQGVKWTVMPDVRTQVTRQKKRGK